MSFARSFERWVSLGLKFGQFLLRNTHDSAKSGITLFIFLRFFFYSFRPLPCDSYDPKIYKWCNRFFEDHQGSHIYFWLLKNLICQITVRHAQHVPYKYAGILESVIKIAYNPLSRWTMSLSETPSEYIKTAGYIPAPVSYTHLDVYKRQKVECNDFKLIAKQKLINQWKKVGYWRPENVILTVLLSK